MKNDAGTAFTERQEYGLLAVLLGLFAVVYYCLSVSADTPLFDGDDAVYMLMADYFSPFSGRSHEITELVMRHSMFPPLYPLLLGLFGATSAHIQLAHVITLSFLIGAFAFYFFWLRLIMPGKATAYLLLAIFAVLPITVFQSFGLLSENLYLMLSLAALLCADQDGKGVARAWVAAAAVGLATVTRSIGVILAIAYLLYLLRNSIRYRTSLVILTVSPLFGWIGWKWLKGYHGDYGVSFYEILSRVSFRKYLTWHLNALSHELMSAWVGALNHLPLPFFATPALILGLISIAGAIWRAQARKLDGFYVVGYVAVILLWPYSYEARRFLYVVIPILLAQGLFMLVQLSRHVGSNRLVTVIIVVYISCLGVVVLPAAGAVAMRAMTALAPENHGHGITAAWYAYPDLEKAKHRETEQLALIRAWSNLSFEIPETECIYHIKPVPFMLYANRMSHATPYVNSAVGDYLKLASECRFFYVGAYVYAPYQEEFFPLKLLGERAQILKVDYIDSRSGQQPLGMLVRVVSQGSSQRK